MEKAFFVKTGNKENPDKNTYYWYKKELDVIKISLNNLSQTEKKYIELNNKIQERKQKIKNREIQIEEIKNLNIEYHQKNELKNIKGYLS